MKNFLLLSLLIIVITRGHSQPWETVKFDDFVSVQVPEDHWYADTLGQEVFRGQGTYGVFVISKLLLPDNATSAIRDADELNTFYFETQKGYMKSAKATYITGQDFEIRTLKARRFELESVMAEEKHIIHVTMLYVNNILYSFSYVHLESIASEAAEEKKHFFKSIKPSKLVSFKDQLTVSEGYSASYQKGKEWGSIVARYLWPSLLTTGTIAILLLLFLYFKFQKR